MLIASPMDLPPHAAAAFLDVCNSAALRSPTPACKAAAGSCKLNAIKNLQGLCQELLFITPVVRHQAVLVTTLWASTRP
jgi:hypothetical protein